MLFDCRKTAPKKILTRVKVFEVKSKPPRKSKSNKIEKKKK